MLRRSCAEHDGRAILLLMAAGATDYFDGLIARRAGQWQSPQGPRGHVEFFMERLIDQPARSAA